MTVRYTDEPELVDPDIEQEEEELPRRPRRRLVTPVTTALAAVLLLAGGFLLGVEVQKGQGSGGGTGQNGFAGVPGGGGAGGGGGGGNGQGGAQGPGQGRGGGGVQGTVANLRGSTLYVTDSSGSTVRVKTGKHSEIVRAASSRAGAVQPGDTVIVQGKRNKNGSYSAQQVTATAKGVSLFGGVGGGGPPGLPGAGGGAGGNAPSQP